mgnify:CR=1 FL=1
MKWCPECGADVEGLLYRCDCCGASLEERKKRFFTCGVYELPQCFGFSSLTYELVMLSSLVKGDMEYAPGRSTAI